MNKGKINRLVMAVLFSLILATLLYPGLEKLYLYKQTNILEDLVMGPLAFLGENQTILSNDDKFARYNTKYKSLDLLPNRDYFIGIKNEFNFHERWANLNEERERIKTERWSSLKDFRKKVAENTYAMFAYGPDTVESDLYYILTTQSKVVDNYCEIFLPSTEHRCILCKYVIRTFFRENETCSSIVQEVLDYYANNFYKICRIDELTANFQVRGVIGYNGFYLSDRCENGGTLLTDYNDKDFRMDDFLNILYSSLLIATVILFKFKRRLIIYVLGILIILWLPLGVFNDNFVSDTYLNESSYIYAHKSLLDSKNLPQSLESETIHDADYYAPAIIYEISQKDFFPIGRYTNDPSQS